MEQSREQKIQEILEFVDQHKETVASRSICARILGYKESRVDEEIVDELRHRLPRSKEEEIEACYYLIK